MNIAIGADHGGFELKNALIIFLKKTGHHLTDFGCTCADSVDYPDYGFQVAEKVAAGVYDRGILICKSGIGMSIVANKVKGIRAVLCLSKDMAIASRKHNDANVLVLSANSTNAETAAVMVKSWLDEAFEGGRHEGRIEKIRQYEQRHYS